MMAPCALVGRSTQLRVVEVQIQRSHGSVRGASSSGARSCAAGAEAAQSSAGGVQHAAAASQPVATPASLAAGHRQLPADRAGARRRIGPGQPCQPGAARQRQRVTVRGGQVQRASGAGAPAQAASALDSGHWSTVHPAVWSQGPADGLRLSRGSQDAAGTAAETLRGRSETLRNGTQCGWDCCARTWKGLVLFPLLWKWLGLVWLRGGCVCA